MKEVMKEVMKVAAGTLITMIVISLPTVVLIAALIIFGKLH